MSSWFRTSALRSRMHLRDNAQNWSSILRTGVFISNSVKPLLTAAILNIAG